MVIQLFRAYLGAVLRATRTEQGRTLRDVSARANVSLGYLSEVERGSKEVSSEMLAAICEALDVPLWQVMSMTANIAKTSSPAAGEAALANAA